ncbi:MAG TPA: TerB N-terminal domain-containing protein [Bacillota bacterium]|nr:TerB N-terminal domain-containing protein [Bacillota bacterium]
MKNGKRRLPGVLWWIVVFFPVTGWAALFYIGIINSSVFNILASIAYTVCLFRISEPVELTIVIWVILIIHNILAYTAVLRKLDLEGATEPQKPQKRLPGKVWRVVSFVPLLNWTALLYIGGLNLNIPRILCSIIYAAMIFARPDVYVASYVLSIVHYVVAHRSLKAEIDAVGEGASETLTTQRDVIDVAAQREPTGAVELYEEANVSLSDEDFSDAILPGDKERTQAIPMQPVEDHSSSYISKPTNTSYEAFFEDMRKYANRTEETAQFVPFMTYWPTYSKMNAEQEAWYFYWRSQVRLGNYIHTDLSYIFVYIYEILSGIGWEVPQDGYRLLIDIWFKYRERFPKLDGYLIKWVFDFAWLHGLEPEIPFGDDLIHSIPEAALDRLIESHADDIPLRLPFPLIVALSDHNVLQSEFYTAGNQDLMRQMIPKIVTYADIQLREKLNKGILDEFDPDEAIQQEYRLYESAVCPQANLATVVALKPYARHRELREYITKLVMLAEDVLEQTKGYDAAERDAYLAIEIQELIESIVKSESGYETRETDLAFVEEEVTEEEREVVDERGEDSHQFTLDFDLVNALRKESEAVRVALQNDEGVLDVDKIPLTSLPEITAIYCRLSQATRDVLHVLRNSNWSCELDGKAEQLISEINNLADVYIGSPLLFQEDCIVFVHEQYRDELEHVCDDPPTITEGEWHEEEFFDTSLLDSELREFVQSLRPEQKRVMYALLTLKNPEEEINAIADEYMTMPEILIDDINAVALQTVGDLIIDVTGEKPEFFHEYEVSLTPSISVGRN